MLFLSVLARPCPALLAGLLSAPVHLGRNRSVSVIFCFPVLCFVLTSIEQSISFY